MKKIEKYTTVITHPGVFHADDVCCVAILESCGFNGNVERRTPTPEEIEDPTVLVVDVGGVFDKSVNTYDHHQKDGAGERENTVPYAAFGLLTNFFLTNKKPEVAARFDEKFVQAVDAADCGWGSLEGTRPIVTLSHILHSFNPVGDVPAEERDAHFRAAVDWVKPVLGAYAKEAAEFVAAKDAVLKSRVVENTLVLDTFVPWSEHIFDHPEADKLLYVVFPSERGGYIVQQMPRNPGSFEGRKPLPESWAGLRGESLATATGVADATFCHPGRFCGGAESLEGTLKLAELATAA